MILLGKLFEIDEFEVAAGVEGQVLQSRGKATVKTLAAAE
jgi:hypothetical protein